MREIAEDFSAGARSEILVEGLSRRRIKKPNTILKHNFLANGRWPKSCRKLRERLD